MVKAKTEAPRRGRPPGVKNKPKRQVKTPLDKLKSEYLSYQRDSNTAVNALNMRVKELEHEIIGYQAVISYLENQLGLKRSM
jgi:hypothetical protein